MAALLVDIEGAPHPSVLLQDVVNINHHTRNSFKEIFHVRWNIDGTAEIPKGTCVYRWSPFVSVDSHQMLVLVSQLKLLICVTQVELWEGVSPRVLLADPPPWVVDTYLWVLLGWGWPWNPHRCGLSLHFDHWNDWRSLVLVSDCFNYSLLLQSF